MVGKVILVSIEAGKEITDYALEWAVQNVIKPMDSLILLVIISPQEYNSRTIKNSQPRHTSKGFFSRNFRLLKKQSSGKNDVPEKDGFVDDGRDIPQRIYNVCAQMIHHVFSLHKVVKVHTEVKVVAYAPMGSVAMVATELSARWVILDQRLKNEADCCLKQYLNCNVVLINGSLHKILRSVNFPLTMKIEEEQVPTMADMLGTVPVYKQVNNTSLTLTASDLTPTSFNTQNTSFYSTSSSNEYVSEKTRPPRSNQDQKSQQLNHIPKFDTNVPRRSISGPIEGRTDGNVNHSRVKNDMTRNVETKAETRTIPYTARRSVDGHQQLDQRERDQSKSGQLSTRRVSFSHANNSTMDRTSSVRRDMSLSLKKPPTPPPLCSVCKHSVPVLGRSPRRFSHEEIERATDGFAERNFLAEGGYGQVYRGVLSDGQVVAVKQRKMVSAQGASEFCSEVEVLSCAQHKNLVMLIGYCIEKEWLLVYEFACNGSLDKHLYGLEEGKVMSWENRRKVACGAARALRYLHEDCRVGCIVHRDFRPNNILLTHDFEPMVGDFGLARWQADGQLEEETRVVGAFGYLAPEYTQTGLITEKADVYAFGVVLLEILTGIKAIEFSRTSRQKYFPELGRHLFVDGKVCAEMIDPKLGKNYDTKEVEYMIHAACLCLSPQPDQRPRMSKVLRILEGNFLVEVLDHHQEKSPTQKPSLESYNSSKDRLSKKQEKGQDQKPIRPSTKLSSISLKLQNHQETVFKPTTPPHKDVISDDYQEYLQGSFKKHIQSLNMKL